ncbi:MAG: DUF6326 family protein [Pseudomonadota bacterium]
MLMSPTDPNFGKTLSLLWLFAILNMLFRDIHEFTMAHNLEEILAGSVNGNPMSESILLVGAVAVELLLLGFLLSALLAPKAARWVNLVLAPLAIFGTTLGVPNDPDDYFFAAIVIATFMAIFVLAWRWAPQEDAAWIVGDHHVA